MTALEDLRTKVADGTATTMAFDDAFAGHQDPFTPDRAEQCYFGSLNAAKALHQTVLPGWSAVIQTNGAAQLHCPVNGAQTPAYSNDPARAWLLAILDALIAKETTDAD